MEKLLEQFKNLKLDGSGMESAMERVGEFCDKLGVHDGKVGRAIKKSLKQVKKMHKEGRNNIRECMDPLLSLSNVDPEMMKLIDDYQKIIKEGTDTKGIVTTEFLLKAKDNLVKLGIDATCFDLFLVCKNIIETKFQQEIWNETTNKETVKDYLQSLLDLEEHTNKLELRYYITMEVIKNKQLAVSQWNTIIAILEQMVPKTGDSLVPLDLLKISMTLATEKEEIALE